MEKVALQLPLKGWSKLWAGKQHTEGEENRTLSDHSQIPRKISNLSISPPYPELESLDPVPLLILPVWCPSNSL